jgi:integrase/recombinase XerD
VNLSVKDYFQLGKRSLVRISEKGGKEKEIPVHQKLEEILDEYLTASGLKDRPDSPLFPTILGRSHDLSNRRMTRRDGARLLQRRLKNAKIIGEYSPHSFRATGITNFLEQGGTLEAAPLAGHADSRTTKLYDRRDQRILVEDVERIRY